MSKLCFVRDLEERLRERHPAAALPGDWEIVPEASPPGQSGEVTVNCFRLAKPFGTSPVALAEEVREILSAHPDVAQAETAKAFVNLTMRPGALARDTVGRLPELLASAALPTGERRRLLVEYSAPNTNKPQHLGHVRNNTLGMALVALLNRVGHEAIPVNLVNDRGIHICKSMLAYQRFGGGITPAASGQKGDHLVGDFYVRFDQELRQQLAALRAARPELAEKAADDLFLETEIGQATQAMLKAWEAGDPAVRELWRTMNAWVLAGFAETYRRMGVEFVRTYLESETWMLGRDYVLQGVADGVFQRRADGAVVCDLGGKLGEKVLLRSDGTSIYITQDIGTTIRKAEDFRPDGQIWVVGDEQIQHFQNLFAILGRLGHAWASDLHHLAYGMVNLPSGRMKSREGTVVDADDLFDEMHALARAATLERCAPGEAPPEDLEARAETIAMGALKFMLLKFGPRTAILFDPGASLRFEGDTGPYVQYACARIASIERKGRERGIDAQPGTDTDWALLGTPEEKALAFQMWLYPRTVRQAAAKMDPSILAAGLLDLAKAFNRFYRECPVLNAPDEALARARLVLCCAARDLLRDGLATLTIGVPDAM
jgi:arginyl-tRNA synthetase